MKTLDALLYQWVGEADESRIERAFRAYYSAAFPSLVRYVQHRTGWDPGSAEDIAQEALLRFFERADRGRREAVALVRSKLLRLNAAHLKGPGSSPIGLWAEEVMAFADAVSRFRPPSAGGLAQTRSSAEVADLGAQIMPLQSRGWDLLEELRRALQSRERAGEAGERALPELAAAQARAHAATDLDAAEVVRLVRGSAGGYGLDEGAGQVMQCVLTVVATLPRLRVPTNGFLFEIATTTILDEIKRRRRRKRGGAEDCVAGQAGADCLAPGSSAHPVEALPDDPQADADDGPCRHRHPPWAQHLPIAEGALPLAADPVTRYESEELLEKFYDYLRCPVARAARALEQALARGNATLERRRFDSVSRKFSRTMRVLAMMGEGYTQEEAARCAGLSRNQVKYIIESVKEAYMRFAADDRGEPPPRVIREGESHVS